MGIWQVYQLWLLRKNFVIILFLNMSSKCRLSRFLGQITNPLTWTSCMLMGLTHPIALLAWIFHFPSQHKMIHWGQFSHFFHWLFHIWTKTPWSLSRLIDYGKNLFMTVFIHISVKNVLGNAVLVSFNQELVITIESETWTRLKLLKYWKIYFFCARLVQFNFQPLKNGVIWKSCT